MDIFESCCSYWLEWKERRSYYSTLVKFAEISILSFRISALFLSFSSRYPCNGSCRVVVDVVISLRIDNKARMSTKQTSPTSGKNKILYQCGARLEAMDYTLSWWVVLPKHTTYLFCVSPVCRAVILVELSARNSNLSFPWRLHASMISVTED